MKQVQIATFDEVVGKINTMKLSYSSLCAFMDNPAAFIRYKMFKDEPTPAMVFGELVHCFVLEPDRLNERFFFHDLVDRRTKEGKLYMEGVTSEAGDRRLIDSETFEQVKLVGGAVLQNPASRFILNKVQSVETSHEWEFDGLKFTGRTDLEGEDFVGDLKVMTEVSPDFVRRRVLDYHLHLQAAMYRQATGKKDYYLLCVDHEGSVSVHKLSKELIEAGARLYERLCMDFHRAMIEDAWTASYEFWQEDLIYSLDIPAWYKET